MCYRIKQDYLRRDIIKKYDVDYAETFSPVVQFESVRTIMALTLKYDLQLYQMDVSSAFLNGKLDKYVYIVQCTLYMLQPKNYIENGKEN